MGISLKGLFVFGSTEVSKKYERFVIRNYYHFFAKIRYPIHYNTMYMTKTSVPNLILTETTLL